MKTFHQNKNLISDFVGEKRKFITSALEIDFISVADGNDFRLHEVNKGLE